MTREEVIQIIKESVTIQISTNWAMNSVAVTLLVDGEVIDQSCDALTAQD